MSFVISVDGPAASGKSSVAKRIAKKFGAIFVNSGAMYRAVTWAALDHGVNLEDAAGMTAWVGSLDIQCGESAGESTICINGTDPENFIREERVNSAVSKVAAVPEVRRILSDKLRSYLNLGSLVMEGRDIGSVVFPDTPYKFYVDASEEVRASRRSAQGEKDSVAARDKMDASRKTAPLKVPDGATVVDSSEMTLEEVVAVVLARLSEQGLTA